MSSANQEVTKGREYDVVGRILCVVGGLFLSVAVGYEASTMTELSVMLRTIVGVGIAMSMVAVGQQISRRTTNWWLAVNLMASGYGLAYFFTYATYYVGGLRMLDTPYLSWAMGPALAALATYHGYKNRQLRWVSMFFTLTVTGHAIVHVMSSAAVITLAGFTVQASVVGTAVALLWCLLLSNVYKRLEPGTTWAEASKTFDTAAEYLLFKVAHELYFALAAGCAMILPTLVLDMKEAPIYWSVTSTIMLALSWKHGNFIKHGVVALIWVAAAVTLLFTAHSHAASLLAMCAVPVTGLGSALVYRYFRASFDKELKVAGYCAYLYVAVAVGLLVPLLQLGVWGSMNYWLLEGLIICAVALALRDGILHTIGMGAVAIGMVLFFGQWNTWTWGLVGPVVFGSLALSLAYGKIAKGEGWKKDPFLTFGGEYAVDKVLASRLEMVWTWVCCLLLLSTTYRLVDHRYTVMLWAVEALGITVLAFGTKRTSFWLQSVLAYGLTCAKLLIFGVAVELVGLKAQLDWFPQLSNHLFSAEFAVAGISALISSVLYFKEYNRIKALAAATTTGGDQPASTSGDSAPQQHEEPHQGGNNDQSN